MAWFLLHQCSTKLFQVDLALPESSGSPVPGWSGFNSIVSSSLPPPLTNIGYCPMIAGSSAEYSTIYIVMQNVQKMIISLGQSHSVITFDLAIYMKAKEIQWRFPEEFDDMVIRVGGFHIALNYLAVIGKKLEDSGLEDLLIESGVFGSSTASALLKGKSYNRGVRAHKIVAEAMQKLQWQGFSRWLTEKNNITPDEEETTLHLIQSCRSSLQKKEPVQGSFQVLCGEMKGFCDLLDSYCEDSGARSYLFSF